MENSEEKIESFVFLRSYLIVSGGGSFVHKPVKNDWTWGFLKFFYSNGHRNNMVSRVKIEPKIL